MPVKSVPKALCLVYFFIYLNANPHITSFSPLNHTFTEVTKVEVEFLKTETEFGRGRENPVIFSIATGGQCCALVSSGADWSWRSPQREGPYNQLAFSSREMPLITQSVPFHLHLHMQ